MYSSADYSVTPRPNYLADGRKIPDCYTYPSDLRDQLQNELGQFPLFKFWGPGADIASTRWIADATILTDKLYNATLTLVYLPHLDYSLQKHGQDFGKIAKDLKEIDAEIEKLVNYFETTGARVILLSEYGIVDVSEPIHINRILREHGWIAIRRERGLELLDAGASRAFVVADHQIAHVYVNDDPIRNEVERVLKNIKGVELVLDKEAQKQFGIQHERSGDFVVVANEKSWFTYYFWMDDAVAPDYARMVDIHKKPGYDPVELFMTSKIRAGFKLLKKKLGFRSVLNVIPLDATLVRGSHGRVSDNQEFQPCLITDKLEKSQLAATDVYHIIWNNLFDK